MSCVLGFSAATRASARGCARAGRAPRGEGDVGGVPATPSTGDDDAGAARRSRRPPTDRGRRVGRPRLPDRRPTARHRRSAAAALRTQPARRGDRRRRPQDVAHLDARRLVTMLRDAGVPILGAVENMSALQCPHCGERIEVFPRVAEERSVLPRGPAARRDSARPGVCEAERRAAGVRGDRRAGRARARVERWAVKKRLDVLLVERGLAESRAQAQALVMAGLVPGYDKPGHQVDEGAELAVKAASPTSRAGERSSRTGSTGSASTRPASTASMSARRPAASRTSSSSAARRA